MSNRNDRARITSLEDRVGWLDVLSESAGRHARENRLNDQSRLHVLEAANDDLTVIYERLEALEAERRPASAPVAAAGPESDPTPHTAPKPARESTEHHVSQLMYGVPIGDVFAEWYRRRVESNSQGTNESFRLVIRAMLLIAHEMSPWATATAKDATS